MSASIEVGQKRSASIEKPSRSRITIKQKRWLLAVHLLFTTAWLGSGFCSLALNIIALNATDPHVLNASYTFAETLDTVISRGGAGGTLLTGIALALLTQWRLTRFYWIIAKEIGTLLCVATDFIVIQWNHQAIISTAAQGLQAFSDPLYLTNRNLLLIGVLLKLIILSVVIIIAIFKPWGQRKRRTQVSVPPSSSDRRAPEAVNA